MKVRYSDNLKDVDWKQMKARVSEDDFDNGRTPQQLRKSFENSYATCIASLDGQIIGTARVLSDGVCNAYLIDVWTYTPYRRRGIARTMIEKLLKRLQGQHVYLQTDNELDFYKRIGFTERPMGLEKIVGKWLKNKSKQK